MILKVSPGYKNDGILSLGRSQAHLQTTATTLPEGSSWPVLAHHSSDSLAVSVSPVSIWADPICFRLQSRRPAVMGTRCSVECKTSRRLANLERESRQACRLFRLGGLERLGLGSRSQYFAGMPPELHTEKVRTSSLMQKIKLFSVALWRLEGIMTQTFDHAEAAVLKTIFITATLGALLFQPPQAQSEDWRRMTPAQVPAKLVSLTWSNGATLDVAHTLTLGDWTVSMDPRDPAIVESVDTRPVYGHPDQPSLRVNITHVRMHSNTGDAEGQISLGWINRRVDACLLLVATPAVQQIPCPVDIRTAPSGASVSARDPAFQALAPFRFHSFIEDLCAAASRTRGSD